MHCADYDAVEYDGEIYCVGCLRELFMKELDTSREVDRAMENATPIFAGGEWCYPAPRCAECGEVHTYMDVLDIPDGLNADGSIDEQWIDDQRYDGDLIPYPKDAEEESTREYFLFSGYVLDVNDHGNATLYSKKAYSKELKEIWSRV